MSWITIYIFICVYFKRYRITLINKDIMWSNVKHGAIKKIFLIREIKISILLNTVKYYIFSATEVNYLRSSSRFHK